MKYESRTIGELLAKGAGYLNDHGRGNARLDAELLLAHVLQMNRSELFADSKSSTKEDVRQKYEELLNQRGEKSVPLAYLTGKKEFMSLDFRVTPDVLIPRPETEILVEELINRYRDYQGTIRAADIGTGSGCIAISLCHYLSGVELYASDVSNSALQVARENAKSLNVAARITFFQSKLFREFRFYKIDQNKLDFIVSNPPYIARADLSGLPQDVRNEPLNALDGGPDGLEFYRTLIPGAASYLKNGGLLALELGADQLPAVKEIFRQSGSYKEVSVCLDLSGFERVVLAERADG